MKERTSDAVELLDLEFGDDPEYQKARAEERLSSQTERAVYEARQSMGLTQKELREDTARVNALLRQWQQEYGLPPRPDGKGHTSVQELFVLWDAEDAERTPAEVEAERSLWEENAERSSGITI